METLKAIIQSPNDKRVYKAITLANKLTCLLISDPTSEKAAASLDVGVGALEDPWDKQGLAHFLEHMLFLGTEKFPDEKDYGEYLSKNSGSSNAYTSLTDTNYFFDCKSSALEGALDRFSQFFIAPLFTESCTEREMNAVESEHQKNIMQDSWRKFQLFKSSAHPENPYAKFATGNKETLNQPGIRDALIEFHKKYYSANLMKLVVYGAQDIETLERWVEGYFAPVKNYDYAPPTYTQLPFSKENFSDLVSVVPVKDKDSLEFIWILEDFEPYYRSNPGKYYSHLFGHEGKNSLLSLLIEEGLALELSAGPSSEMKLFTEFKITVSLTKEGLARYKDVIAFVFKYLDMLKKRGPSKDVFEEINIVGRIRFAHKENERPSGYVSSLSASMQKYPIEDVLQYPYMFEEFKPDQLKTVLDSFTLDNLRILLCSKELQGKCTESEKWYQTKYSREVLPDTIKDLFLNPNIEPKKTKKILDLPPKNVFLPKNLEIIAKSFDSLPKYPQKVYSSDLSELYFKQDNTFKTPKGDLSLKIYSNDHGFGTVLESHLLAELWVQLFNESLREILYSAEMAALYGNFSLDVKGLLLNITGFNDSIPALLEEILQTLKSFKVEDYRDHYTNIYQKTQRALKNVFKNQPYQQGFMLQNTLLKKYGDAYHPTESLKVLNSITFEKLVAFQEEWLSNVRAEWLVLGNFTEETVVEMVKTSEKIILSLRPMTKVLAKELIPESRLVNILPNSTWVYQHDLMPDESGAKENNSAIISYFQYELWSIQKKLLILVLTEFLKTPFFDDLRTKQQLGYIVSAMDFEMTNILGFLFIVQSSIQSPNYLSEKVIEFLDRMRKEVHAMSDTDFLQYRDSVLSRLKERDYNLRQESNRYWSEISKHTYLFDRKERLIEEINNLKKEQLVELFEEIFYTNRRLLETHVVAEIHGEQNTTLKKERIEKDKTIKEAVSIEWFKRRLPLYPDYHSML